MKLSSMMLLGLFAAGSAAAAPLAGVYTIPKYGVVPAVMNDKLVLSTSHPGDQFSATVVDDRDLPRGTKFIGHVREIHPRDRDKAPSMELSFDSVIYPDGSRQDVEAVPIPSNSRGIHRDNSGHYHATSDTINSEGYVFGGLFGGLGIGGLLFHKPLEGAIIGAIAGIFASEASKHDQSNPNFNQDVVATPGARIGVLMEAPLHVSYMSNGTGYVEGRPPVDRYGNRGDDSRAQSGQTSGSEGRDRYGNPIGGVSSVNQGPPAQAGAPETPPPSGSGDDMPRAGKDRYGNPIGGADDASQGSAPRAVNAKIVYEGKTLEFSDQEKPVRSGATLMVAVLSTARQLDLNVVADDSNVFYVEDDSNSLRLERDSASFRLNGKRGTLAQKVVSRDGVLYAPIDIIAAMKERPVYVNGTKLIKMSYN